MLNNLFIFSLSLFLVLKGAAYAARYATLLAGSYRISKYTVGFIIVAFISILPETFIGISSALDGIPAFGLGTLFGSNIADLTLIFAVIILYTGKKIKIESNILKNIRVYPLLMLLPIALGFDGMFSRIDGIVLILTGCIFFFLSFKGNPTELAEEAEKSKRFKYLTLLVGSLVLLLVGSHFIVSSASAIASIIGVNAALIGILIVGLGTTIPEFLFSVSAVKKHTESLGVGDILGTVLADATIVVGILAIISPFAFPVRIVHISGIFMLIASILLSYFMRTEKAISRKEAVLLLVFWILFVCTELLFNA